jgi:hypothetical protein
MWDRLSLVFTRSWKLVPAFAHERYLDHAEDGETGEEDWGLRPSPSRPRRAHPSARVVASLRPAPVHLAAVCDGLTPLIAAGLVRFALRKP